MPPVDEILLLSGKRDIGDLSRIEASAGRQNAAHIKVEVRRRADRGINVRHEATGPEVILRNDGHAVRQNRRRSPIQRSGNFHDRAVGQVGDRFIPFPLGLLVHVHGELVSVRPLNHE